MLKRESPEAFMFLYKYLCKKNCYVLSLNYVSPVRKKALKYIWPPKLQAEASQEPSFPPPAPSPLSPWGSAGKFRSPQQTHQASFDWFLPQFPARERTPYGRMVGFNHISTSLYSRFWKNCVLNLRRYYLLKLLRLRGPYTQKRKIFNIHSILMKFCTHM